MKAMTCITVPAATLSTQITTISRVITGNYTAIVRRFVQIIDLLLRTCNCLRYLFCDNLHNLGRIFTENMPKYEYIFIQFCYLKISPEILVDTVFSLSL